MEIEIGRGKKARRAYGFDDIAIVPSRRTRDAEDVDIGWKLGPYLIELPLLASAMDGVVSPSTAIELGRLGGLEIRVMETPGHTSDSLTYLVEDAAFIGDTLFAPGFGTARCDFPEIGRAHV